VIALNGEQHRKVFFDNRNLDIAQGYKILMGLAPDVQGELLKEKNEKQVFVKDAIRLLLRNNRVPESLATSSSLSFLH
jgi:hypothetical protein